MPATAAACLNRRDDDSGGDDINEEERRDADGAEGHGGEDAEELGALEASLQRKRGELVRNKKCGKFELPRK